MGELSRPGSEEVITDEQPEVEEASSVAVPSISWQERERNFEQDVDAIYDRFASGDVHDYVIHWAIANHFGAKNPHDIHFDLVPYIRATLNRAVQDPALASRAVFNAGLLATTPENTRMSTLGLSVLKQSGEAIVSRINQLGNEAKDLPSEPIEESEDLFDPSGASGPRYKAIQEVGKLANGLSVLVELGSHEQVESARALISEASDGLITVLKLQTQNPDFYEFAHPRIVDLILLYGTDEQRAAVTSVLAQTVHQPPKQVFNWLDQGDGKFEDWKLGTFVYQILEKYCMEKFGLSEQEYTIICNAWHTTRPKKADEDGPEIKRSEIYWRNIIAMRQLEEERPGSVKELFDKFNIVTFGRYSKDCLLNQLDMETGEEGGYYGLVLYPASDWNGVFYNTKEVFDKTNQYFVEQTGAPVLRVFECQNHKQAVEALNTARKKYGPIGFSVIGGHGTRNSVQFGEKNNTTGRFEITLEDLEKYSAIASHFPAEGGSPLFSPGATIILKSCSTGQEGGIAQKLSEIFGIKVIGPDIPTALIEIRITKTPEGYIFEAFYADEGSERAYSSGEKADGGLMFDVDKFPIEYKKEERVQEFADAFNGVLGDIFHNARVTDVGRGFFVVEGQCESGDVKVVFTGGSGDLVEALRTPRFISITLDGRELANEPPKVYQPIASQLKWIRKILEHPENPELSDDEYLEIYER